MNPCNLWESSGLHSGELDLRSQGTETGVGSNLWRNAEDTDRGRRKQREKRWLTRNGLGLEFPSGSIWTLQKAIRIYHAMKNSAQEIILGAGQQDFPKKSWTLTSGVASGQFEGTSSVLREQQLIRSMSVKLPPNPESNNT